jgi:hypothetical protein
MLAQDLMGLGVPPLQAARTANAGTGPMTITAAGTASTSATAVASGGATRLGATQYVCVCTTAGDTTGASIVLPTVGTDAGAYIGDDFVINNQTSGNTLFVWASTGVTISVGGVITSYAKVGVHTTMALYPQTTTVWFGIKGS